MRTFEHSNFFKLISNFLNLIFHIYFLRNDGFRYSWTTYINIFSEVDKSLFSLRNKNSSHCEIKSHAFFRNGEVIICCLKFEIFLWADKKF